MRAETQQIQQPHLVIAQGQPGLRFGGDAAEHLGQQAEDGDVFGFVFVGKAIQQLDRVGSVTGLDQVRAEGEVGIERVGLGDDEQVTAPRKLQGDAREGLEMAGLARADLAGALGDGAQLAALTRVERQEAVSFAPVGMTQDDGFDPEGTGFFHGKIIAWEQEQ